MKSNIKTVVATNPYGEKFTVSVDSLELSAHVYGVAIDGDKVLISPQHGGYDWPGGTMELGETHIETLKREYKEETGLDVEPTRLLNVFSGFYHSKTKNHNRQSILIYYLVKIIGGEISTDGFDDEEKEYASVAEWKTLGEIKKMHHACSLDAKDHLVACVKQAMEEDKK